MNQNIKFSIKKIGFGHYKIYITKHKKELGSFNTKDPNLINDTYQMVYKGYEHKLLTHDSFVEVKETVLTRLNK